nr:formylglycine-generating enzyme family protein [Treponemataceae bacterium]
YTLHVTATYKNVGYDADFELTGNSDSLSAQGFVAVAGATVSGAVADSVVFIAGRTVTIPNLYVCDHEVTQAEFAAVMENNTSNFDGSNNNETVEGEKQKNRPVESVSWFNMLVYCNKRSSADGLTECYTINGSTDPDDWGAVPTPDNPTNSATWNAVTCDFSANGYRLPTEAEWEYLARSGNNGIPTTQTTYSGSNTVGNVAWYHDNSGNKSHEVKKKTANSLGLYDMSGNVWEWCWDWLGDITSNTPATGVSSGSARVSRGGSWYNNASYSAVSYRNSNNPLNQYSSAGFRVVRTNKAPVALPAGTNGTAGTNATYILFGDYPQTVIASGVTVDEDISKQMGAFTYYFGSDGAWYVKLAEKAYETGYTYSDGTAVARGGTSYKYFKVEPIKWRVLTTNYNGTGNKLLVAENLLINHRYAASSNNYANSEIRSYINNEFYNAAFTSAMQNRIATTIVVNDAASSNTDENPNQWNNGANNYASNTPTSDKIFLLSETEATTTAYGFGAYDAVDTARVRNPTDFALASGAYTNQFNNENDGGWWWLRSPYYEYSDYAHRVHYDCVASWSSRVDDGYRGIVPALCIDN